MIAKNDLPGIVIPAYNPAEELLDVVSELLKTPYPFIFVINDGSDKQFHPIFEKLKLLEKVHVIRHAVNRGKGEALKTGFNGILDLYPDVLGVVTVDADGQHLPKDVKRVAQALSLEPKCLWLGVRKFEGNVPLRSRFGNILTNFITTFFIGQNLGDTQTGLRGIPSYFLEFLVNLRTNGYDYELDMILQAHEQGIEIKKEIIDTIYENNNESSHFNPVWDSLKIYFVFIRFIFTALLSVGVDTGIFTFVYYMTNSVMESVVTARIFSSLFNFFLVKNYVFKSRDNLIKEFLKYASLVVIFATLSIHLINFFKTSMTINIVFIKLLVEGAIFIASFSIQRVLIFIPRKRAKMMKR